MQEMKRQCDDKRYETNIVVHIFLTIEVPS